MDCENRLGPRWMVEGDQKALAELSRKIHYAGYLEELTLVSGFRIQQDAAGVDLVRLQIQAID